MYNVDQVIEGFVRGKTACLFKDPDLDTGRILQCWSPNSYRLCFFFEVFSLDLALVLDHWLRLHAVTSKRAWFLVFPPHLRL